ncbi:MAG: hypothetical protein JSW04_11030 [Desulfobacterales bacterium]|nr:MAG: hypothetical protein JSW04_11030 [Desulfobacterales bacterium]
MKPIYFPFTFISEPVFDALSACFGKIVVYQSSKVNIPEKMKEWAHSGQLEIRIPIKGDEVKIDNILQDFKDWAELHQGSELSILKTQIEKIPFFSENAISQITLDIKRQNREKPARKKPDVLFNARLFLQIAQEHDFQADVLRKDFLLFETMENNLMKNLKGEIDSPQMDIEPHPSVKTNDTGHYMTKERIAAWIHIMAHDDHLPGLFVTHSRSVIEHLLDTAPEAKILRNINDIPAAERRVEEPEKWHIRLMNTLETIITDASLKSVKASMKTPAFIEIESNKNLTFFIIPEISPRQFFSRYIEPTGSQPQDKRDMAHVKNTLIGWYDI